MSDALGFLPDTKPDVAEPWRKVLLDAADYIEAHGWRHGHGGSSGGGPVCAWVATTAVVKHSPKAFPVGASWEADQQFARFLGVPDACSIPNWNDAPDRTTAKVTTALRACARQ